MINNRRGQWRPILEGSFYDQAVDAVQAVSIDILASDLNADSADANSVGEVIDSASLAGGRAGKALFYGYLAQSQSGEESTDAAISLLEMAVDTLSSVTMSPSLYGGFAGVAWAVEHLQGRLIESGDEDTNEPIDEALIKYFDKPSWSQDYELISGLVGFGVYALERAHRPSAVKCLERVIALLDETAERTAEGVTWHTSPDLLVAQQRAICPQGYYNLGLAHGVPGVIALLGEAYAAGIEVEKTWPLLDGAVHWLLAQKITNHPDGFFSAWVAPDIKPVPKKLSWCYGDLGVSAALMSAARCVNEPSWEREALDIALRAAELSFERSRVEDASICHGTAGIAHIFNRFYQASGEERFKEAACFWFERALEMRIPGEGIGGYRSLKTKKETMKTDWFDDPGFLTGAAGVGLSLLAAVTNVEPAWDRALLTSIPLN